jgi:hypothetical protein
VAGEVLGLPAVLGLALAVVFEQGVNLPAAMLWAIPRGWSGSANTPTT